MTADGDLEVAAQRLNVWRQDGPVRARIVIPAEGMRLSDNRLNDLPSKI